MHHLLDRLGLGRKDLRAWAMYDWANSAFQTTIIAAVFPIYYQKVAAAGQLEAVAMGRFAWATTIAILIVAIIAPVLGAVADYTPIKKRLLAIFIAVGAAATIAMFWIRQGDWTFALVLFVIGNVGVAGSIVFYESLLPHLVGEKDLDRVSAAGYAMGYVGGGGLLAINLLMIQKPALFGIPDAGTATRLSLASVGVWWIAFSIPLFRHVPEPAVKLEADLPESAMITALLLTQFIGIPCAFAFGMIASRISAKVAVFAGLGVYVLISLLGYFMTTATHFFALAILVGMVQGGTQALSRSLFASMIPRYKSSEFFAFFSVFERYAGVLGPAIFAFVIERSGSGRSAILAVAAFFIIGAAILSFVDVDAGRRAARAAEAELPAGS
jgi:UMF1 family MFS transporter